MPIRLSIMGLLPSRQNQATFVLQDIQFLPLQLEMKKKRSEETQTLRAGCSKAEPKIFAPPQTPFPGARDAQNVISWRWSLPLPTDPVW